MDKQHNTTQHNTTQHNTTQHNTTQHNTTQHNTTQHNNTTHRLRLPSASCSRLTPQQSRATANTLLQTTTTFIMIQCRPRGPTARTALLAPLPIQLSTAQSDLDALVRLPILDDLNVVTDVGAAPQVQGLPVQLSSWSPGRHSRARTRHDCGLAWKRAKRYRYTVGATNPRPHIQTLVLGERSPICHRLCLPGQAFGTESRCEYCVIDYPCIFTCAGFDNKYTKVVACCIQRDHLDSIFWSSPGEYPLGYLDAFPSGGR
jgi:hypothetical protein